jgi:hypothetical protein
MQLLSLAVAEFHADSDPDLDSAIIRCAVFEGLVKPQSPGLDSPDP